MYGSTAPWQYNSYEYAFSKRRANSNTKRLFKDCSLIKTENGFDIMFDIYSGYVTDPATNQSKTVFNKHLLATITPDNVLTFRWSGPLSPTACRRLTTLSGRTVLRNKSKYRKYKQHIRVYCGPNSSSRPYFAGMQWDVSGGYAKLLNPQPDTKVVIDKTAVTAAKQQINNLRKLVYTMFKLGSFDEFAYKYGNNRWSILVDNYKTLSEIDFDNLTIDDAMAVVVYGARFTNTGSKYVFSRTHGYQPISQDQVIKSWLARSINCALKELRANYYKSHNGYIEILEHSN